jgi:hypothetical protein
VQIVFNKGAVMVLPAGVNKASGLAAALVRLRLSPLNVVGIGDAENDHAFLRVCGCAVAVANALPMVKAHAGGPSVLPGPLQRCPRRSRAGNPAILHKMVSLAVRYPCSLAYATKSLPCENSVVGANHDPKSSSHRTLH